MTPQLTPQIKKYVKLFFLIWAGLIVLNLTPWILWAFDPTQIEFYNLTSESIELSVKIVEHEKDEKTTSLLLDLDSGKCYTLKTEGGVKTIFLQSGEFSDEETFDQWNSEDVVVKLKTNPQGKLSYVLGSKF